MPTGAQRDQDRVANPGLVVRDIDGYDPGVKAKLRNPAVCRTEFVYNTGLGKWQLRAQFPTGAPVVLATEP